MKIKKILVMTIIFILILIKSFSNYTNNNEENKFEITFSAYSVIEPLDISLR